MKVSIPYGNGKRKLKYILETCDDIEFQFPMGMAKVNSDNIAGTTTAFQFPMGMAIEWGCSLMEPKVSIPYGNGKRYKGDETMQNLAEVSIPYGNGKRLCTIPFTESHIVFVTFQFPMGMAKVATPHKPKDRGVCFNSLWEWQKESGDQGRVSGVGFNPLWEWQK